MSCSTGSINLPSMRLVTISGRRPSSRSLAAHHLNEDGELEFAAAEDLEGVWRAVSSNLSETL